MKHFAPIIIRIGIGLVFLWFGSQQLFHASSWIGILPDWTKSLPITQITFVHLNGWFEIIFGTMLIAGLYVRIVSLILALHLLSITLTLGMKPNGVRDFGLTMATFAIFFYGMDGWCLDHCLCKQKKK